MDTVTHALVGTAISDGWFRRRLGPVATPFALAVSALPDVDVVTYFISPDYAWANHRGYSHSFFVMLLAAPVLGYLGHRVAGRTGTWKTWALLALLCLYAHTLFDLITSWGTMPLLPFSNARISWDIVPILDVFLTSVSLGSFVLNRLLRWEKVETFLNPLAYPLVHRHPGRQRAADAVARVAAALLAVYLGLGWHQNRQTVREARRELAAAAIEAVEVRALPLMFTYVASGIAARDAGGTVYNAVYSSYAPRPMRFAAYPTIDNAATRGALATREGRLFAWYSQGMFVARVEESPGGMPRIRLEDRRFFTLSQSHLPRFAMDFCEAPDPGGRMVCEGSTQMGFDGVDLGEEARRLWALTVTGDPEAAVLSDPAP
jgi:membrane-bound metal-dependent hydrolase YbcI (DUF457 family)